MATPSLARRLLEALRPAASSHIFESIPSMQTGFYSDANFGVGIIESDPTKRREIQQQAYVLWQTNPLGGAIINWTTMFVLGEGVAVSHPDSTVNEYLQDWWDWMNMDELQTQWCDELSVFGELFLEKIVNQGGRLSLVSIDPRTIYAIQTDPNDVRKVVSYEQRYTATSYGTNDKTSSQQVERTIPAANMIHWKVNHASFAKFGSSDLLRALAAIPMYNRWLSDRASLNAMKNNYFMDVTVKGGAQPTKAVIDGLNARGKHMGRGSINVHSDTQEWKIMQPTIAAGDSAEDGRALKLYTAAAAGLPEYLLGDASNANLASTKSQEMPMVKKFKKRQKTFARLLRVVLSDVIGASIAANDCPATFVDIESDGKQVIRDSNEADQFIINFPQIIEQDVKTSVDALLPLFTSSLVSGRSLVTRVGMDYDEEQTQILKEQQSADNLAQTPVDDTGATEVPPPEAN